MEFTSDLLNLFVGSNDGRTLDMGLWERMKPPIDLSINGHRIDELFAYTTYANLFFFTLVCLGLFGFSFFYAKKRNKSASYNKGDSKKQIALVAAIALSVFLFIDMRITKESNQDYTGIYTKWPKEDDAVRIQIMGQQWMWNVRYPGKDQVFNTADDVVLTNDFRVPQGKKVVVQVISKDVIHSFSLPNTRRKVDAIPGRVTRMWFELKKDEVLEGEYPVVCAEMCGTNHYKMQAKMTVYSQDDYEKWYQQAQEVAAMENDPKNLAFFWGWKWVK
ncbi:MAG: hypothetical protein H6622_02080 [Halobacteriovoraceae bacterium]|nr:hypothetical protein [Halobacteriovoraceae bacterium]